MVPRTGNRRWGEHRNEGFLDSRNLPFSRIAIAPPLRVGVLALLERLQCHEHDAGVRAVGEPIDGQAGKLHSGFDGRVSLSAISPIRRMTSSGCDSSVAPVGQLREANQDIACPDPHEARQART